MLHELRAAEPKIPAVMLLDSTDRDLVIDAFRGGARGVFCRDYSFDALPKCIRQVYEGHAFVSPLAEGDAAIDVSGFSGRSICYALGV